MSKYSNYNHDARLFNYPATGDYGRNMYAEAVQQAHLENTKLRQELKEAKLDIAHLDQLIKVHEEQLAKVHDQLFQAFGEIARYKTLDLEEVPM